MEIIVLNCIWDVVETITIKAEDDVVTSNAKASFKDHPINTVFGGLRQQTNDGTCGLACNWRSDVIKYVIRLYKLNVYFWNHTALGFFGQWTYITVDNSIMIYIICMQMTQVHLHSTCDMQKHSLFIATQCDISTWSFRQWN